MLPTANRNQANVDSDEISLKDLLLKIKEWFKFLLSKWKVLLIAGALGAVIGIAYAIKKKPVYKAALSFALQEEKSGGGLGSALGLASQFGIDMGGSAGGQFSGDNLLELMKSRSMIERALLTTVVVAGKKLTLADYYIDFNGLRDGWTDEPSLQSLHFLPNQDRSKFTIKQDSILGILHANITKANLSVDKLDKKLSIISVKVNSTNELFAKYFTESLTTVVSDFYIQTKTKKGLKNVTVLQRQTDSVRRELNAAISGVASSIEYNPNPNPMRQTLQVASQRRQVDVQANGTILNELVKNLEMAKMSLLQETPLIQIIDKPILPLPKDKLSKVIAALAGAFFLVIVTSLYLLIQPQHKNNIK